MDDGNWIGDVWVGIVFVGYVVGGLVCVGDVGGGVGVGWGVF